MTPKSTTTGKKAAGRSALEGHFFRKAKEEIHYGVGVSSLGRVLVARGEHGVVAVLIGKEIEGLIQTLRRRFPKARLVGGNADCEKWVSGVAALIEQPGVELDFPLDLRGTGFQQKVWQAVREIPLGQTSTYAEIAEKVGSPKAVRAVGGACSNNRLALVIPCHRVLRSDGSLSGGSYWGNGRQRILLDREAAAASAYDQASRESKVKAKATRSRRNSKPR